jgi:ABC-type branched-subunit amino acid transport system ATPase component
MSGILFGFRSTNVQFQQFGVFGSITAVLYTVVGGVGWASGTVIGAVLATGGLLAKALSSLLSSIDEIDSWLLVVSGASVVVLLRLAPDGVAALHSKQADRLRARWARRRPATMAPGLIGRLDRARADLEIQDVTVRFGGVVALDGVSFRVRPGEVVGLMGPNGAGKTTLVDAVTGFSTPNSGEVLLGGRSLAGWSPERRARAGIARSWQAVELFDEMTVLENLLVAADRHERSRYLADLVRPGRPRSSEVVEEIVAEFGLADHLGARPSSLPQGTARLVGIGRAIVTEPSVLLLDEPAAGLAEHEAAELGREVRRIAEERSLAVLVIEHDVSFLLGICDRLVVLDFGRVLTEGTPEEVAAHPEVVRAYLGTASTQVETGSEAMVEVAPS